MKLRGVKLAVTGANGFIGTYLAKKLRASEVAYEPLTTRYPFRKTPNLVGLDTIIHLAAIGHGKIQKESDSLSVNRDYPIELGILSKKQGVRRFVFISTVNVYSTEKQNSIDESEKVEPITYSEIHKYHAENKLLSLADNDFSVIILRIPLVYASDAPANFSKLLTIAKNFSIQPFGLANNKKSFLSINNLTSALIQVARDTSNISGCFNVTDGYDISTKELVNTIRLGFGLKTYQIPLSPALLRIFAMLIGKKNQFEVLFNERRIEIGKFRTTFGWEPVEKPSEALMNMRSSKCLD